jgi:hypothetical protein
LLLASDVCECEEPSLSSACEEIVDVRTEEGDVGAAAAVVVAVEATARASSMACSAGAVISLSAAAVQLFRAKASTSLARASFP